MRRENEKKVSNGEVGSGGVGKSLCLSFPKGINVFLCLNFDQIRDRG